MEGQKTIKIYTMRAVIKREDLEKSRSNKFYPKNFTTQSKYVELIYVGKTIQSLEARMSNHQSYERQISAIRDLEQREKDPDYVATPRDIRLKNKKKRYDCATSLILENQFDLIPLFLQGQKILEEIVYEEVYNPSRTAIYKYKEQLHIDLYKRFSEVSSNSYKHGNEFISCEPVVINNKRALNIKMFNEIDKKIN